MVRWTDTERKHITTIWSHVDQEQAGHEALTRLLVVYPWTQRYFKKFGNLGNASAIAGNSHVRNHGKTVMGAVDLAIHNLDHVADTYTKLSILHSDTLHVDPHNFRLLSNCLSIVLAKFFPGEFNASVQASWQKLLDVICSALSKKYH